ncbi:MAG: hypothetical protein EB160_04030 [Nitrososphaeria archaeon]|nr:hypothetical protein [Nitrososphaeria archaeon]
MIKMRKTIFLLAIISASVVSLSGVDQAFAHQRVDIPTTHQSTNIRLTVGHSNEPAYGASRTHDGLHGFEMSIVDKDTKLPVSGTGTSLKLDKYYFKNVEKYNKATSSNQADKIDKNIQFGSVFGSPGTYLHRQIVDTGVYGYRIYGTVSYYGVKTIPVDVTAFCDDDNMNSKTKFEIGTWSSSFGCPTNMDYISFPNKPSDK